MNYIFNSNLKGLPVTPNKSQSKLTIVWSNDLGSVSYHHAYAEFIDPGLGLFNDPTVIITVDLCYRNFNIPKKITETTTSIKRYLPYRLSDGICHVDLNDIDILNAISADDWSKSKDGTDLQLKCTPTKISIALNNHIVEAQFNWRTYHTPSLMVRAQLRGLDINDTFEHNIYF